MAMYLSQRIPRETECPPQLVHITLVVQLAAAPGVLQVGQPQGLRLLVGLHALG